MSNASGYALVARPFNAFSMGFGGERFFRVYQHGEYLLFVTYTGRSKWQLFWRQFGLLGALIWMLVRKSFERKRDALLAELDRTPPDALMQRDKHNFAVHRTQLLAQALEPTGFWKRGVSSAAWHFNTPDKGALALQLPTPEDVTTLLQNMPQFSPSPLNVKVVWNEAKKRYLKPN
jgi:hypothetical protein